MFLQLARLLAARLPQEPLQEVLHGAEHPGGVICQTKHTPCGHDTLAFSVRHEPCEIGWSKYILLGTWFVKGVYFLFTFF